jgi:hypothetical protein
MTALELEWQGVTFTPSGGAIAVSGPGGREDLRAELLAQIEKRQVLFASEIPLVADAVFHVKRSLARAGECDTCGDSMRRGRGGMCALCVIALQRALRSRGRLQ